MLKLRLYKDTGLCFTLPDGRRCYCKVASIHRNPDKPDEKYANSVHVAIHAPEDVHINRMRRTSQGEFHQIIEEGSDGR